jgi:DNA-directed RNA polymerase subunit RPC12/RpoP
MIQTQTLDLICQKCKHQFTDELPIHCKIQISIAAMEAMSCPACGSKKVAPGIIPPIIDGPSDLPAKLAVRQWMQGKDTGMSSISLAKQFLGISENSPAYPHDPDDLGRCLRLIAIAPEVSTAVDALGMKHKVWAALATRWDEIAASMANEVGISWEKGHSAPATYALMRSIIQPAEVSL